MEIRLNSMIFSFFLVEIEVPDLLNHGWDCVPPRSSD